MSRSFDANSLSRSCFVLLLSISRVSCLAGASAQGLAVKARGAPVLLLFLSFCLFTFDWDASLERPSLSFADFSGELAVPPLLLCFKLLLSFSAAVNSCL